LLLVWCFTSQYGSSAKPGMKSTMHVSFPSVQDTVLFLNKQLFGGSARMHGSLQKLFTVVTADSSQLPDSSSALKIGQCTQ
jgi:hypothetical protein